MRVERLAERLSVAKSGFYWHFKDRSDLLRQVLEYWSTEFTEIVATYPKAVGGKPEARLREIARLIDAEGLAKYDLAIRAWAKDDEIAAETVRKVTEFRLAFISEIFAELGFAGSELEARARFYVCYYSMEFAVLEPAAKSRRAQLRRQQLELLTGK